MRSLSALDARAYALVFLLTALSFLFFARARRRGAPRDLAWWAVFSALAIATHYFAGFVVAAEGALLILGGNRRRAAIAVFAVVAVAALLVPIAQRQAANAHAGWISQQPLGHRLERAGAKLLGADYFDGRNLLPMFVPLLLVLGAGFGVRRAGWVGFGLAGAFCLCSLVFTVEIDRLPRLQREDLRNGRGRDRLAAPEHRRGHQPLRRQPASALLPRARFAEGQLTVRTLGFLVFSGLKGTAALWTSAGRFSSE
jgi:hypothetical protein